MRLISWEEALLTPDLAKGEIEIQILTELQRGPIGRISIEGNDVLFHLRWCATSDVATEDWTASGAATALVFNRLTTEIALADDGRLIITGKNITVATIHPQDGEKLDPAQVFGLNLADLPQPETVELG